MSFEMSLWKSLGMWFGMWVWWQILWSVVPTWACKLQSLGIVVWGWICIFPWFQLEGNGQKRILLHVWCMLGDKLCLVVISVSFRGAIREIRNIFSSILFCGAELVVNFVNRSVYFRGSNSKTHEVVNSVFHSGAYLVTDCVVRSFFFCSSNLRI